MADNWVSPTGHNDPDSKWYDEADAYDSNTGTYAGNARGDLNYYLELTIASIACDKVRIYAQNWRVEGTGNPTIDIDVYYASAWHNIFSGEITKDTWVEKAVGSTKSITKARVKNNQGTYDFYLFEFEFNSLPPTVETDACSGVKPTSLDANGDISVSGGVTTRGFHYSKVFDGFEWGSDADPLSDDGGAIDWTISVAGTSKAEIDTAQHYAGTRSARLYCDGTNIPEAYFPQSPVSATQAIGLFWRKDDTSTFILNHHNGTYGIVVIHRPTEQLSYYDGAYHDLGLVSKDVWHSLIIKNTNWSAQTYDIYCDGILVKSGADMITLSFHDNNIVIRNASTGETWVDEIAVWDIEDEDGSFGEGEYSLEISGLDSIATYYVQAFAKNPAGFGYGDVVSTTTSFVPSSASAIAQAIAPTVIRGSISLTPTPVGAVGLVIDPQVILSSTDSSPPPADSIGQAIAPTVIQESLTFVNLVASASTSGIDPYVNLHSTQCTPIPASAIAVVVLGDVLGGTTEYTPVPAEAIADVVAPTASGSQTLKPAPAQSVSVGVSCITSIAAPQIHVESSFGTVILNGLKLYEEVVLATPVLKGKSFIIITCRSNTNRTSRAMAMGYLTDEYGGEYHKIRIERAGASFGQDCYVDWQVVTGECFTVQEGETSFSNGDEVQTPTIDTVDLTKTFLTLSNKVNANSPGYAFIRGRFLSGTTLEFRNNYCIPGYHPTVRWCVVTWEGATVQSGTTSITSGFSSYSASINEVELSHSFIIHSYYTTAAAQAAFAFASAKFDNSTTVKFIRGSSLAQAIYVSYFVVSVPNLTVQEGEIQLGSTETSNEATLGTPVDISLTFLPSICLGNAYCTNSSYNYLHRGFSTQELAQNGADVDVIVRRGISGGLLYARYFACTLSTTIPTISIVEAVCDVVAPTVIYGSITITPSAVSAIAQKAGPTVVLSPVIIAPTAISAVGNVVAPSIIYGSVSITPSSANAIASTEIGTIIMPSITVTPTAITAVCTVYGPTVTTTDDVIILPTSSNAVCTVVLPTVVHGSITLSPDDTEYKFEFYSSGDDAVYGVYDTVYFAQTFTPSNSHAITKVKLLLYRAGSPGTLTISIQGVDVDGYNPDNNDLCSGTTDGDTLTESTSGEWREITLDDEVTLLTGTRYAIVVKATEGDNSNRAYWRGDNSAATYEDGNLVVTGDSGGIWNSFHLCDLMFEEWGTPSLLQAAHALAQVALPTVTTGDVVFIPTAVNAVVVSIPPTVIGGDVTLILSAATAVANVNPPSIGLSSMVVTPTPVSAVTGVSITVLITTLGYQTKVRIFAEPYHELLITTETYHEVEILTKTYHDVTIWTGESNMAIRRDWERGETIPIWAEVKLVSTGALYSPITGSVVLYVYDPDGIVIATINGIAMDEDSTGMFVYYWSSPTDADAGWHRAKGKVTDGAGETAKVTIENGGFNIRE